MKIKEMQKSILMLPNDSIVSRININQELEKYNGRWALKLEKPLKESFINKYESNQLLSTSTVITKSKTKNLLPKVSFQQALKMPLLVGQCIGMIPLFGITNENNSFKFTRRSYIYAYCLCFFTIQVIAVTLCIIRVLSVPLSFSAVSDVVFYGGVSITTLLFFRIARGWPELMRDVATTEEAVPNFNRYLKMKCGVATVVLMSVATFEHILSIISNLSTIMDCYPEAEDVYKAYMEQNLPWLYDVFDIDSLFFRILLQLVNLQATLNWNYSDLFIICISFYLEARIEQLNERIIDTRGKYISSETWRRLREDYNRVTRLVRHFDDVINCIIFVSFANNLYFICFQMFNTLSRGILFRQCDTLIHHGPFRGHEHTVYFIVSLLVLLARSTLVSLIAAGVHSASLIAAPALYDVPSRDYCVEVERFLEQLHGDSVALTGLKFFKVTRGLVLSVAGTVVTYELVLLQFNRDLSVAPRYNGTESL